MNKELIMALDALEKENGIDKEIMFAAIEKLSLIHIQMCIRDSITGYE